MPQQMSPRVKPIKTRLGEERPPRRAETTSRFPTIKRSLPKLTSDEYSLLADPQGRVEELLADDVIARMKHSIRAAKGDLPRD